MRDEAVDGSSYIQTPVPGSCSTGFVIWLQQVVYHHHVTIIRWMLDTRLDLFVFTDSSHYPFFLELVSSKFS
jgi:hypothetical protein